VVGLARQVMVILPENERPVLLAAAHLQRRKVTSNGAQSETP
jgi:hypothetical protein